MRQILWTCVAVWLASCDIPPEVKAQIACETVCTCLAPSPLVDECVSDCVADGDLGNAPDECFECIQVHANQCSTLEDDCEPLCDMPQPPPPPGFDGGML